MDQRRQLATIIALTFVYLLWVMSAPLLFPQLFPKPKPIGKDKEAVPQVADQDPQPAPEKEPGKDPVEEPAAVAPQLELPKFPEKIVTIGAGGLPAGYLLEARLSTLGGAVEWVKLTEPEYLSLDRQDQIRVVGNPVKRNVGEGPAPRTFETQVAGIDEILAPLGVSLNGVHWEIVAQDAESVTFRYPAPDSRLEILKRYRVPKIDPGLKQKPVQGYMLDLDVVIRNRSDAEVKTTYVLTGPVGMPLENVENTLTFREIKLGTLDDKRDPNDVTAVSLDSATLVKQDEKARRGGDPVNDWRAPLKYAGVAVQFFAALVYPQGDQLTDVDGDGVSESWFEVVRPVLLEKGTKPERSDFTIALESRGLKIAPGDEVTHSFQTFLGPKRPELLREIHAEPLLQFGWFGGIARLMIWILHFFHHTVGLPYAFAIILLTVCVRGAMLPISKKQAIEAEKMRILAPEMKKLQERYKDQPEEFAKAYREFQRKHNYHPMVGCLPALLQLPIFIGLYRGLYQDIDLRLARFWWIDNLAAPDSLFQFGFTLPWPFGWSEFNLLPILTVALFMVQQKLTVPPATSEEQEMQYRIMNVVTIAIGFAFYRVPAGLCLYFIASSIWGVIERQLLKRNPHTIEVVAHDVGTLPPEPKKPEDDKSPAKSKMPGWFERLREAADQAKNSTEGQVSQRKFSKQKDKKGKSNS